MEKRIWEFLVKSDDQDLNIQLHSEKFAKIRNKFPVEWEYINSLYLTKIDITKKEAYDIILALSKEIQELEDEVEKLKKPGFFKKFFSGGYSLIFSIVFGIILVIIILSIVRLAGPEFYKDIIHGFGKLGNTTSTVIKSIKNKEGENGLAKKN